VNSVEEADVADSVLIWQIIFSIKRQLPFHALDLLFVTSTVHSGTFFLRSVFVGHLLDVTVKCAGALCSLKNCSKRDQQINDKNVTTPSPLISSLFVYWVDLFYLVIFTPKIYVT